MRSSPRSGKVSGGGSRPYGYEADKLTIRPAEAAIVKECARRFLAGESIRSLCVELNERGERASSGGEWSPQTLRQDARLGPDRWAARAQGRGRREG